MKRRLFAPPSRDLVQKQQFRHEAVYSESPHTPQDVLCYGSDDDAYDDSIERQLRIEHQANRFLHGRPMLIASATLHGPFEKDSGWNNPWRSRLITPSQPRKRLRLSEPNSTPNTTTATGEPRLVQPNPHATTTTVEPRHHQPNPVPLKSSLYVSSPEPADDQAATSGHVHEYLDNVNFSRVRSWRDEVVNEAHMVILKEHLEQYPNEKTPRPEPTPITNMLPHYVPTAHLSSSLHVVCDSFDSSRIVQPSSPQKQEISNLQKSASPHIPIRQPGRERTTSSLQNNSSFVTTPAKESQEPIQPQPQPQPQLAPNEQPDHPVLEEVLEDPSSSELSELSQFSQEPREVAASFEAPVGSSKSAVKTGKESAVAVAKHLDTIRLQDSSDRSFRFRSVVPLPDPGSQVMAVEAPMTETRTQKEAEETGRDSHQDDRASPAEPEHENVQLPEESMVVKIEPESPGATESHIEHAGVNTTNARRIDTGGDAIMVDRPVLAPSTVSSGSELSELVSMGNFSSEKQSQTLQEMNSMPRKLLWPKSEKGTTDTSLSSDPSVSDAEKVKGSQTTEKEGLALSDPIVQPSDPPRMPEEPMGDNDIHDQTAVDQSQHIEDREDDIEQGEHGVCASLGTPLSERHEQQSPVRNSQIGVRAPNGNVAGPIEDEHPVDTAGPVSPSANASPERLPSSQSLWANEPTRVQTSKVPEQAQASPIQADKARLSAIASHVLDQVSQSPWAKGDSQIAADTLPDTRLFNPISSPAKSTSSPLQEITLPNLPPAQSPCNKDASMPDNQSCPPMPSTPELKRSNLPTPEYTHSIKSFREFMTPSPQKPRPSKIRRISSVNDGHLPSTQALVEAAVSNPWLHPAQSSKQKASRKMKHVSWAPLPGEEDLSITVATSPLTASPPGAEFPEGPEASTIRIQPRPILRSSRATSPPLQSFPENLPAEQEKFGRHFAAMANRRTIKRNRARRVTLPSASQQSCDSPQVEAMAERFLAADEISSRPRAISIRSDDESREPERGDPRSSLVAGENNARSSQVEPEREESFSVVELVDKNRTVIDVTDEEEGEVLTGIPGVDSQVEVEVDPVNDVMQNLDDFFENTWEIDDSGVFSKAGETPSRNSEGRSRLRSSGIGRFSSSAGAMDTGIWDL